MKTLNKLVVSLMLLSCAKGFALDLNFINSIKNYNFRDNVKSYFSNMNVKKASILSSTAAAMVGVAYKYKDKLKTLASKLKNKSVSAKNYLLSKFSTLKSKIQGINNKKKKGLYAGALALASSAAYLAYKKYKNQNKKLEAAKEE